MNILIPFITILIFSFTSVAYTYEGLELDESEFFPIAKKFVNNDSLNVRNNPVNGEIIGKLSRGDAILIYDVSADWSRISKEKESPQWLASKYLCSYDNCYKKKVSSVVSKSANQKAYKPNKFSQSYSGACSCSSGTYCYGPRGGRYCYTSGGNKSYR